MVTTNHSLPSEADFARLEGELFTRIDRKHRAQVLRHRLAAVAIVAVVAGAGVAAGTVANPTQQNWNADCYSAASATADMTATSLSVKEIGSKPSAASVTSAVAQCAALWQAGLFGAKSTPPLQACLGDNLVVAVFPRSDAGGSVASFCENLGMSKP